MRKIIEVYRGGGPGDTSGDELALYSPAAKLRAKCHVPLNESPLDNPPSTMGLYELESVEVKGDAEWRYYKFIKLAPADEIYNALGREPDDKGG